MTTTDHKSKPFKFKQFTIQQDRCAMKVGTDGILLGAWARVGPVKKALDIGTGTGLIAIMLAQRCLDAEVHAVEINEVAFSQAKENMATSPFAERLTAINQPIQDYAQMSNERYDLIISNPPFFSGGVFSGNEARAEVRHTTKLPHGDLLVAARTLLDPNGRFCVILPYLEGLRLKEMARRYNLHCSRMTEVRARPGLTIERLLLEFQRFSSTELVDELYIYGEGKTANYSAEYIELTEAFYLDLK